MHLTVRADADRPAETLCERTFQAGEYSLSDADPSCAACIRRRDDPSRISNALFGQDLGSKLLELSIANARKRPEDQKADDRAARAAPPKLTVVPTEPRRREPAEPGEPPRRAPEPPQPSKPVLPEIAGLDLSRFERVGRDLFRSPGGVMVRVVLREYGGWDVAEIDHEGETRISQLADGRVRVKVGDVRIEYSGKFERRIRIT